MKKVSTVAMKQGREFSQPALTIGLDLGDRNSWYCVLDESGQIQLEQRVRTTGDAFECPGFPTRRWTVASSSSLLSRPLELG